MSDSAASVLHDINGQAIGSIEDTTVSGEYRTMVQTELAPNQTISVVPVTANDFGNIFRQKLEDGTNSPDMVVDGSTTPVEFTIDSDPVCDLLLTEVRLVFVALSFDFGGASFGSGGSELTNGVLIEVTSDGITTELGNLKVNEDVLLLPVRSDVILGQGGNEDVMALSIDLGGVVALRANTSDKVKVTIRDDLTVGSRQIAYFEFSAFGIKRSL